MLVFALVTIFLASILPFFIVKKCTKWWHYLLAIAFGIVLAVGSAVAATSFMVWYNPGINPRGATVYEIMNFSQASFYIAPVSALIGYITKRSKKPK